MQDIIALLILLVSGGGIFYIIIRKIPVLVDLNTEEQEVKKNNLFLKIKSKSLIISQRIKSFSFNKFFHKILSKLKIFILRLEKFIDYYLQKTRKKNNKEEEDKDVF